MLFLACSDSLSYGLITLAHTMYLFLSFPLFFQNQSLEMDDGCGTWEEKSFFSIPNALGGYYSDSTKAIKIVSKYFF